MDRRFYPLVNLFLDLSLNPRSISVSDALLLLCRRYDMPLDDAKILLADAVTKRWFRIITTDRTMKISAVCLRCSVSGALIQNILDLMKDGVWRSTETVASELGVRVLSAADACLMLEAIGVLDSRMVWPKDIVYATIRGAEPILYSPDFTLS